MWIGCFNMCVIILSLQCVNPKPDVVHIAVIIPTDVHRRFSHRHVQPAIEVARQHVIEKGLLPGMHLDVHYGDSKCNSMDAPIQAFDFYRKQLVNVFVGPVCDYSLAPVARYAPYWNIPVISAGGFAHDFGQEKLKEYSSLTRIGVTFNSLAVSIITIAQHFNWTKVKVIYEGEGYVDVIPSFCFLASASLIHYSKMNKLDCDFHMHLPKVHTVESILLDEVGNDVSSKYILSLTLYCFQDNGICVILANC